MCTLCLSDMGELRDEWLREPKQERAVVLPLPFTTKATQLRDLGLVAHVVVPARVAPPATPLQLASVA